MIAWIRLRQSESDALSIIQQLTSLRWEFNLQVATWNERRKIDLIPRLRPFIVTDSCLRSLSFTASHFNSSDVGWIHCVKSVVKEWRQRLLKLCDARFKKASTSAFNRALINSQRVSNYTDELRRLRFLIELRSIKARESSTEASQLRVIINCKRHWQPTPNRMLLLLQLSKGISLMSNTNKRK